MNDDWNALELTIFDAIALMLSTSVEQYRNRPLEENIRLIEHKRLENAQEAYRRAVLLDQDTQEAIRERLERYKKRVEFIESLYVEIAREITLALHNRESIIKLVSDYRVSTHFEKVVFTATSFQEWAEKKELYIPFSPAGDIEPTTELLPESLALSMTWALLLDAFMELNIPDWKFAEKDPDRSSGDEWFPGDNLKHKKVVDAIMAELDPGDVTDRKVRDHINAALDGMSSDGVKSCWDFGEGFKPKERKAAYMSLYGLAKAIVKTCNGREDLPNLDPDSPEKLAALIEAEFFLPEQLSYGQLAQILRECWE